MLRRLRRHFSPRVACAGCACLSLAFAGCGGGGDKHKTSQAASGPTISVPPLRSAKARRRYRQAVQDQLAISQMSVLVHPVDRCGRVALKAHTSVAACATPEGLVALPGAGVKSLGPNVLQVPSATNPGLKVRVVFGDRPGQIRVFTSPRGWKFVSRSENGNVFTERKRGYGSRNFSLTCTKRGRAFCPKSGRLK